MLRFLFPWAQSHTFPTVSALVLEVEIFLGVPDGFEGLPGISLYSLFSGICRVIGSSLSSALDAAEKISGPAQSLCGPLFKIGDYLAGLEL